MRSTCDGKNKHNLSSGASCQAFAKLITRTVSSKSARRPPRHPAAASHDADICETGMRPFPNIEASDSDTMFDIVRVSWMLGVSVLGRGDAGEGVGLGLGGEITGRQIELR